MKDHFICCQAVACGTVFVQIARAGFKTVGAHGQDIFRGDVSCQTHFFRGGRGGGGGVGGKKLHNRNQNLLDYCKLETCRYLHFIRSNILWNTIF